jgi:hypothetical protein
MAHILEKSQIVGAFRPVDLQTAANDGDWVSLANYKRCAIVFWSAVGTAGDDPTLTLQQASDVAGTGAKDLTVVTTVYTKQAATDLTGTGQWTKVTQAAATNYTNATSAEEEAIWVVDIDADLLDVDNGFDCLRARVADVGGNAQLGACLYILHEPRYPDAPENMLSAIA